MTEQEQKLSEENNTQEWVFKKAKGFIIVLHVCDPLLGVATLTNQDPNSLYNKCYSCKKDVPENIKTMWSLLSV